MYFIPEEPFPKETTQMFLRIAYWLIRIAKFQVLIPYSIVCIVVLLLFIQTFLLGNEYQETSHGFTSTWELLAHGLVLMGIYLNNIFLINEIGDTPHIDSALFFFAWITFSLVLFLCSKGITHLPIISKILSHHHRLSFVTRFWLATILPTVLLLPTFYSSNQDFRQALVLIGVSMLTFGFFYLLVDTRRTLKKLEVYLYDRLTQDDFK